MDQDIFHHISTQFPLSNRVPLTTELVHVLLLFLFTMAQFVCNTRDLEAFVQDCVCKEALTQNALMLATEFRVVNCVPVEIWCHLVSHHLDKDLRGEMNACCRHSGWQTVSRSKGLVQDCVEFKKHASNHRHQSHGMWPVIHLAN